MLLGNLLSDRTHDSDKHTLVVYRHAAAAQTACLTASFLTATRRLHHSYMKASRSLNRQHASTPVYPQLQEAFQLIAPGLLGFRVDFGFALYSGLYFGFAPEPVCYARQRCIHTWPQEFGQPVQWILTASGMSSCCSSFSTTAMALFLVSIIATPQN